MFTGIVEKTVAIAAVANSSTARRVTVACPWADARLGESVAVNGCCLTVAELPAGLMAFDVVPETLAKTNLALLNVGDPVHLERALRLSDRLDGHIVQGHVDGVAKLLARQEDGKECRLTIEPPAALVKYVVPKGSVALDGVSLTVAAVHDGLFEVAIIPTTLAVTWLGRRAVGYGFNLENDVLTKTIVFWLERQAKLGQSLG